MNKQNREFWKTKVANKGTIKKLNTHAAIMEETLS